MNKEYRILNGEMNSLHVGTKNLRHSKFLVRYSLFTLLILFAGIVAAPAQSFRKIYTNLDQATSVYTTQNAVYVVEQGKNRLLKLNHDGKLLETIGGRGSGDYEFSKPVDVDATNGLKIFVTDYNNRRVQVFDRRGQYLSSVEARPSFGSVRNYNPTQISVNSFGEIFFADDQSRTIYTFDLDYNELNNFRLPAEVKSVDDLAHTESELLLLDSEADCIHRFALNGAYIGFYPGGNAKALFANEEGIWTISSQNTITEHKKDEQVTLNSEIEINYLDLQVTDNGIFLLSDSTLYRYNEK